MTVMSVVVALYFFFGAVGYYTFAGGSAEIITLNLGDNWAADAVKLCLCTGLFFTYPLMMFPVYQVVESLRLLKGRSVKSKALPPIWGLKRLQTLSHHCSDPRAPHTLSHHFRPRNRRHDRASPKKSSPKTALNRNTLYKESQKIPVPHPRLASPIKLGLALS
jgi:hypothetical protein